MPSFALFGAGAKRARGALMLDAQSSGALVGAGAKTLFTQLSAFSPGLVASVRAGTLDAFFSRPSVPAALPRVLLLSAGARDAPLTLRRLSVDFAARASFGLGAVGGGAGAGGAALAAAFGVDASAPGFSSALLLGPAARQAPPPAAAGGPAPGAYGAAAGWARFAGGAATYARLYEWLDARLPRAPLPQLRTAADFDAACGRAPDVTTCIIAVLPADAQAAAAAVAAERAAGGGDLVQTCADADHECARERRRVLGFDDAGHGGGADDDDDDDDDGGEDSDDGGGDSRAAAARRARAAAQQLAVLHKLAERALVRTDWSALSAAGLKAERLPLSLAWVDAAAQPEFAAALGVAAPPALVALNPRKRKAARMRGSLTPANAYAFVAAIMADAAPHAPGAARAAGPAPVAFDDVAELPALHDQPPLPPPAPPRAAKAKKAKAAKKAGKGKAAKKAQARGEDSKAEL